MKLIFLVSGMVIGNLLIAASEDGARSDSELWNDGVEYYRVGDTTNALQKLKSLMSPTNKKYESRAAEVVAKLEYDRGNYEEAANAAHIALLRNPEDARINRNFTRAVDRLPEEREKKRIENILKAAQGKDPSAIMREATYDARKLMTEAGTYRTNNAEKAVAIADRLAVKAEKLTDVWLPVREAIAQSVTNQEQAASIMAQIESAQAKMVKATSELSDLDGNAYATLSDAENDFTRFMKMVAPPPAAIDEDIIAQSNAYLDVEVFNNRPWQQEALDFTRAFRAKFPAWARAYEQQAQSDTNKPPFTAEDQAKISALATEIEKLQLECCEKHLPADQEKVIGMLGEIRELLPKDNSGGKGGAQNQPQPQQDNNQQEQDQKQDQNHQQEDQQQEQDQDPNEQNND